jgi:hypothetical protein
VAWRSLCCRRNLTDFVSTGIFFFFFLSSSAHPFLTSVWFHTCSCFNSELFSLLVPFSWKSILPDLCSKGLWRRRSLRVARIFFLFASGSVELRSNGFWFRWSFWFVFPAWGFFYFLFFSVARISGEFFSCFLFSVWAFFLAWIRWRFYEFGAGRSS